MQHLPQKGLGGAKYTRGVILLGHVSFGYMFAHFLECLLSWVCGLDSEERRALSASGADADGSWRILSPGWLPGRADEEREINHTVAGSNLSEPNDELT
jgi:hypothetical protein